MSEPVATPRISVVVCTRNNATGLVATLDSLAKQTLPPAIGWEVLIVDNGSTDETAAIGQKYAAGLRSLFRYIFEPKPGLPIARNRGAKEARGEIVAFTDDDALADPHWLSELWSTYELEPQAVCVGGKSVLKLPPGPLPAWYSERLGGYLSACDLPYGVARSVKDFPFGVNISFRRTALLQIGGFHPLFGARNLGKVKLQGDETQICQRLQSAGGLIVFQPKAQVTHVVPSQRLQKEYFLGLATGSGYVQVVLDNEGRLGVSTWRQLNKYLLRWYRASRTFRRGRAMMPEPEQFWNQLVVRKNLASIWYCVWAKRQLRRLANELA